MGDRSILYEVVQQCATALVLLRMRAFSFEQQDGPRGGKLLMGELSKLPNIGKTVEEQLNQVGINSVDELKSTGAKEAWLKIQKIDEVKADLKEFYQRNKR